MPGGDTSSNLVPSRSNAPPGFPAWAVTPNPNAALPVSPGIALCQPSIEALVADRSMADLVQSLVVAQARGNPQAGAFSSVMTRLRQAFGLMTQGFQEACLGVEIVVQKSLLEATAHNPTCTAKATKDLDLWTAALQLLFDTDNVSEADMEARRAHAQHTRQVISDWILGQSRQANGHISGHLIPAHVYTAARNHLHGGHSSWGPSTPRGPQLGQAGGYEPAICPSESGAGLPK